MINAEQNPSSYTHELADFQPVYEVGLTESGIIAAMSNNVAAMRLDKAAETEAA